jgi:hypothetical protein
MRTIQGTIIHTYVHIVKVEVDDDASDQDCKRAIWDEYQTSAPDHIFDDAVVDEIEELKWMPINKDT